MSRAADVPTSYDELPYTSFPYPQTHPRHLNAIAQLFGLSPAPVHNCRVLELGCAGGGNLIPIASEYGESQCVGIDASKRQIEEANELKDALGLENVELLHQDIAEFDWDGSPFDYILCHGVYSWVPSRTQTQLLSLCRDHLAENGVAFFSYNTYPGWFLRRGVREMMGFHAAGFSETQTKIDQSRALVDFLAGAVRTDDAYGQLLHEELGILRSSEDSYVFHEHLEQHNEPLFFYEFVQRAEESGLRYLADAQFSTMIPSEFSDSTQQTLRSIAPGIIQMEQYLDFLRNRKFRQSLLCRSEVEPDRSIAPRRLERLFVSGPLSEIDPTAESDWSFEHANGQHIRVSDRGSAEVFRRLSLAWPGSIAFGELREISGDDIEMVGQSILELFAQGLVTLTSDPISCRTDVGETPQSSALVRSQIRRGDFATNQRHERVPLDEFDKAVLQELDGINDLARIVDRVSEKASNQDGSPLDRDQLQSAIHAVIERFAQVALLTK
ncbi:MAG: class I SAM-dependent methyltransferase [Planctomycetota bacterium]